MKKIFSILILCFVFSLAALAEPPFSNDCIYKTSSTFTNETKQIVGDTNTLYFKSVVVSSATSAASLTIYDSLGSTITATKIVVDLSTVNVYPFDLYLSSGLTYTTVGNSNGVSIIYRKGTR